MEGFHHMGSQSSTDLRNGKLITSLTKQASLLVISGKSSRKLAMVSKLNSASFGEASKAIIFESKEVHTHSPILDVDEILLVTTPGLVRIFWSYQAKDHIQT